MSEYFRSMVVLPSLSRRSELVTLAVHRLDEDGPVGIALELPAEPQDVSVHGPGRGKPLVPPHLVQQPLAGHDLPPMLHEVHQQIELLAGQPHLHPCPYDTPGAQVDARVAEGEL